MIVDDRVSLCGSANINDRSMLGDRDSEVDLMTRPTDGQGDCKTKMGGSDWTASGFAHSLRMNLMAEHCGLSSSDPILVDPIADQLWQHWQDTAVQNTSIHQKVFPHMPADDIRTLEEFDQRQKRALVYTPSDVHKLQNVQGHLFDYPSNFLCEDHIAGNLCPTSIDVLAKVFH